MKSFLTLLTIVGCIAPQAVASPPTTITIDKRSFSDIYPAVWFDPNSGTVYKITEESEKPPVAGAVVWIEPGDPEFAVGQGVEEQVGMCVIGYGEEVFANPQLASMIARRMEKTKKVVNTASTGIHKCLE